MGAGMVPDELIPRCHGVEENETEYGFEILQATLYDGPMFLFLLCSQNGIN